MPQRALRPCAKPGCPALTRARWCDAHGAEEQAGKRARWRRTDDARKSSSKRGYGAVWQRLRRMVLSREPCCQECLKSGRTELATEVDHIIPKAQGGEDSFNNLQGLCKSCHSRKTSRERAAGLVGPNAERSFEGSTRGE